MEEIFKELDSIQNIQNRLSLLEDILEDMTSEEIALFLQQYIQYEKRRMAEIWANKNCAVKQGEFRKCEKYRKEFKRVKNYISSLRDFYTLSKQSIPKQKDQSIMETQPFNFFVSFSDRILEFDRFCNTTLFEKFHQLENDLDNISLLETMKKECLDNQKYLKTIQKNAQKNSEHEMVRYICHIKRMQTLILQYLNHTISVFNNKQKVIQKKLPSYEEVFGNEYFTKTQLSMIQKIVNQETISIQNWDDFLISLKAVIRNYSFSEISVSVCKYLDMLIDLEMNIDLKELYFLSIIDTLKHKKIRIVNQYQALIQTSKTEVGHIQKLKSEAKEISRIIQMLNDQILLEKTDFFNEEESWDYQVMMYCIENRIPYYYLQKIISSKPSLCYLEKDQKSILIFVLEKYIEAQKIELRNQKRDYIPKEYYEKFYQLLIKFSGNHLTEKLNDGILHCVNSFKEYLDNSGYKSENKNEAMYKISKFVHQVPSSSYSLPVSITEISKNLRDVTPYLTNSKRRVWFDSEYFHEIEQQIFGFQEQYYQQFGSYPTDSFVCENLKISMNDYKNTVFHCSTVSFIDKHIAYSLLQDGKGSSYLRMHVFDLSSYVQEGDLLEKYLLENAKEKFRNFYCYQKQQSVPSITYQIKLFPNGAVGDLKIYPSVVKIEKEYQDLTNYRQDSVLKGYVATYKKLLQTSDLPSDIVAMEKFFKNYITNTVLRFCTSSSLPVILYGKSTPNMNELMHIRSDLGPVFSKMDKKQFRFYSMILDYQLDEAHYVNQDFDQGSYELRLERAANYADLFNQRLLLSYEKIFSDSKMLDDSKNESDLIVQSLNKAIEYVDDSQFEKNKRKRYIS